jgi:hypothetical protein
MDTIIRGRLFVKSWNYLIAGTALALVCSWSIQAQTANNPALGTWKLNLAKSKFDPGPAPKSQTRIYEATAEGTKVTIRTVTAAGAVVVSGSTTKPDGKSYPYFGNSNWDAIIPTTVSELESRSELLRSGKVIGHFSRVLSTDHKTMTVHHTFTTRPGVMESDTEIYQRQ